MHWRADYLTLDHLRSPLALNGLTRRHTAHSSSSRSVQERALDCVWFWLWYLGHFPSLGLCHHLLKESVELDRLSSSFRGHVSCSPLCPSVPGTEQALGMNYRLNAQRTQHVPGSICPWANIKERNQVRHLSSRLSTSSVRNQCGSEY